jgi:hypothetical protein
MPATAGRESKHKTTWLDQRQKALDPDGGTVEFACSYILKTDGGRALSAAPRLRFHDPLYRASGFQPSTHLRAEPPSPNPLLFGKGSRALVKLTRVRLEAVLESMSHKLSCGTNRGCTTLLI